MERLKIAARYGSLPALLAGLLLIAPVQAFAQDTPREVKPGIHPELQAHTGHFDKRIYKVADNVYSVVGYDLANTIMVEGTNGVIIVDTGGRIESARAVAASRNCTTRCLSRLMPSSRWTRARSIGYCSGR